MPLDLPQLLARQARAFVARVLDGHETTERIAAEFQGLVRYPFGQHFHALIGARLAQDTYRRLRTAPTRLDRPLLERFLALGALLEPNTFAAALDDLGERWGADKRRVAFPAELRMALGRASRTTDLSLAHRYCLSQAGWPAADDPLWDR